MSAEAISPTQSVAPVAEYVVPLRCGPDEDVSELTEYFRLIRSTVDITVVDGSEAAVFAAHATAWAGIVRHLRPDPWPGANRKVAGVVTGVFRARHERVVVADDDVRYRPEQLVDAAERLSRGEVVRPQNVFIPLAWHSRWDTARILLNRAIGADYPGTFALRRSVFRAMGGYDGDVLFENLQMVRTIVAAGGREIRAGDLYVRRSPPSTGKFFEQRIRQAYDDFAQPGRLLFECSWLPLAVVSGVRRPVMLLAAAGLGAALAELGRRRHHGRMEFPVSSALWAPVWMTERAVCVWLAIGARVRGGVKYRGHRIRRATAPIDRMP